MKRCRAVEETWFCEACDTTHDGVPFTLRVSHPAAWTVDAAAHEQSELLAEQCVLRGDRFFLHALLLLPVTDVARDDFEWGIWVEVAEDDFLARCARWFAQGRENDAPVQAQLAVCVPTYDGSTLGIPGLLQDRAVGIRPLFTLDAGNHPLGRDQQLGITTDRIIAFARASH